MPQVKKDKLIEDKKQVSVAVYFKVKMVAYCNGIMQRLVASFKLISINREIIVANLTKNALAK